MTFQHLAMFAKCTKKTVSWGYTCVRKMAFVTDKYYVNGIWSNPKSGTTFPVLNPSTNEIIGLAPNCNEDDVSLAIQSAKEAFKNWQFTTAKSRSVLLNRLYELQVKNADELGKLITLEMGKPIVEAVGEINYGASFLNWFAEEARRINGQIIPSPWSDKMMMYTKEPIGPVAIITPWNFPNAMITRKLGAALACGCTAVIRPSEASPFSALAIAKLAEEAGFPPGVINVVTSSKPYTSSIGKLLCKSPDISAISFTGSTGIGKLLLEDSASTVKRVCLELGGNAPFIVFDSADVLKAVQGCIVSKFRNTGQTCVCANRIFVQKNIHDKFVEVLAQEMAKQLKVGDGCDKSTTVGPLVNKKAVDKVQAHIDDALKKGGKIVSGGKYLQGNFFEPTLITGCNTNMDLSQEETFGPLSAIIKFDTEEEVIAMANSTRVGLAGYFYSQDVGQIWRVSRLLEVGMVGVNEGLISTCEAPFGGVKESGIGREGSHFGVDEFTNVKYICMGSLNK